MQDEAGLRTEMGRTSVLKMIAAYDSGARRVLERLGGMDAVCQV